MPYGPRFVIRDMYGNLLPESPDPLPPMADPRGRVAQGPQFAGAQPGRPPGPQFQSMPGVNNSSTPLSPPTGSYFPSWLGTPYYQGPINSVPHYASGTNYHPGGAALVGESGPEMAVFPKGTKIIPNQSSGQRMQEGYNAQLLARATGAKVLPQEQGGVTAAVGALGDTVDAVSNGTPAGNYWDQPGYEGSQWNPVSQSGSPSAPLPPSVVPYGSPMGGVGGNTMAPPPGNYNPLTGRYDLADPYSSAPMGYPMAVYGQAPMNYGLPPSFYWNDPFEQFRANRADYYTQQTGNLANFGMTLPAQNSYADRYGYNPLSGEQTLQGRSQEEQRQNSLIGRFGYAGQGAPGGPFAASNRIHANQMAALPGSPQYDPRAEQDFFNFQDSILTNSPHRDAIMRNENIGTYTTPEIQGLLDMRRQRAALGLPLDRPLPMPVYGQNPNGIPTGPSGVVGTVQSGYGI